MSVERQPDGRLRVEGDPYLPEGEVWLIAAPEERPGFMAGFLAVGPADIYRDPGAPEAGGDPYTDTLDQIAWKIRQEWAWVRPRELRVMHAPRVRPLPVGVRARLRLAGRVWRWYGNRARGRPVPEKWCEVPHRTVGVYPV